MRPCPDHDRLGCPMTRINRVDGEGPTPCSIMLIGEAPGKDEDKKGKPFIGKSGSELTYLYLAKCANISRSNVYITNLMKCRCNEKDRDPTRQEIRACSDILLNELRDIAPRYVGTLGKFSTQFMCGKDAKMEKVHGFGYKHLIRIGGAEIREFKVMPLYHPAYGLHNTSMMRWIMEDFEGFGRMVRGDTSVMWKANKGDGQ